MYEQFTTEDTKVRPAAVGEMYFEDARDRHRAVPRLRSGRFSTLFGGRLSPLTMSGQMGVLATEYF